MINGAYSAFKRSPSNLLFQWLRCHVGGSDSSVSGGDGNDILKGK